MWLFIFVSICETSGLNHCYRGTHTKWSCHCDENWHTGKCIHTKALDLLKPQVIFLLIQISRNHRYSLDWIISKNFSPAILKEIHCWQNRQLKTQNPQLSMSNKHLRGRTLYHNVMWKTPVVFILFIGQEKQHIYHFCQFIFINSHLLPTGTFES
jgi:hypothetical protein